MMNCYRWNDLWSLIVVAHDIDEARSVGIEMIRKFHGVTTGDYPAMRVQSAIVIGSEPEVIDLPVAFMIGDSNSTEVREAAMLTTHRDEKHNVRSSQSTARDEYPRVEWS